MQPDTSTPDTPEVPKRTFADSVASISAWLAVSSAVAFLLSLIGAAYSNNVRTLSASAALLLSLAGLLVSVPGIFAALLSKGRVSLLGPSLAFIICSVFAFLSSFMVTDPYRRERTPQSKSASNIRQLALALQQYSNDYDGAFPGWLNLGTEAKPRYVHNVWDRQIDPFVKRIKWGVKPEDIYPPADPDKSGPGVRSPSSGQRVLGYALNGALIAPYVNGNCDWSKPNVLSPSRLSNPANTILFAEIVTKQPLGGKYADPGVPGPPQGPISEQWTRAITQWIDIDPKAWVENTGGGVKDYKEHTWNAQSGVARASHGGGGVYAFCDGHVAFQRVIKTTTCGQNIPLEKNWSPTQQATTIQFNQWYPG